MKKKMFKLYKNIQNFWNLWWNWITVTFSIWNVQLTFCWYSINIRFDEELCGKKSKIYLRLITYVKSEIKNSQSFLNNQRSKPSFLSKTHKILEIQRIWLRCLFLCPVLHSRQKKKWNMFSANKQSNTITL